MYNQTSDPHECEPPIDINDVITQLADQQARFAASIDAAWDDVETNRLIQLLSLYGQNASRLGRLIRDRHTLYGDYYERIKYFNENAEKDHRELMVFLFGDPLPDWVDQSKFSKSQETDPESDQPDVEIDDVIRALADKQARLARYLDRLWSDPQSGHLARLLALYSQNASRLGRLLRDRTAIYGPPLDPMEIAVEWVLNECSDLLRLGSSAEPSEPYDDLADE